MEKLFDISLQNRKILYKILEGTPKAALLKIPKGYRNNIWWNIAHVVVTQQLLVYKMSNLPMQVNETLIEKYKKGSVPDGIATDDEMSLVKVLLFSTVELCQKDYENKRFKEYNAYMTSANVHLANAEDAIAFNVFHEGIHLGTILSLLKLVA